MEGGNLHQLPPSKRYKLLHLQDHSQSSSLPAKKRLASFNHSQTAISSSCLPAKKRVFAPHPSSLINLNHPPQEEEQEKEKEEDEEEETEDANLIKQDAQEEEEEDDGVTCAVCRSTDGDPLDPIVFCDGCDLMVHASCYGNPLAASVPEGDWFCYRCERKAADSCCCLCPVKGGATKPTADGRWAHIVCALFVPEVFFRDPEGRDGIDCSVVPPKRWNKQCYLCGERCGCAVACSEPKCGLGFHVSCGLHKGLCFEYKERRGGAGIVAAFCAEHTDLWNKQQLTGKFKIVAREEHTGKIKA